MGRFDGKIVLLAGGGGISTGTAQRLADEGAAIIVGDINLDAANKMAEQIKSDGHWAMALKLDIADAGSVKAFIDTAVAQFGRIDGLFNVAADTSQEIVGRDTDIVDLPIEIWNRTLAVDLTGYFLTIRHAIPHMLKNGGAIVNTTSAAVFGGEIRLAAYTVAKAGVGALTRHVANRWGREGVRCNSVAPGMIRTGNEQKVAPEAFTAGEMDYDKVWTGMASRRGGPPSTRLGRPGDIAATVAFLLSDDAGYINGQSLGVDGGIMFR
jgi:NAD(P)-dependent dehydrogenase (short-subunit alcohol dehydrogenase family)